MQYGEKSTPVPVICRYRSASLMRNSPFPVAISSTRAPGFRGRSVISCSSFSRLIGLQRMCSRCVMSKNFHMSMRMPPLSMSAEQLSIQKYVGIIPEKATKCPDNTFCCRDIEVKGAGLWHGTVIEVGLGLGNTWMWYVDIALASLAALVNL